MLAHLLVHVVGRSISVKTSGCTVKRVRCEHCGAEYIYQLRRTAGSSAYAFLHLGVAEKRQAATRKAQTKLQRILATEDDPVGCPACGWLQSTMVIACRRRMLKIIGYSLFIAGILLVLLLGMSRILEIEPMTVGLLAAICVALAILAMAYAFLRDVNTSAHRRTREALGARCRAMPAAEFDALLAETA